MTLTAGDLPAIRELFNALIPTTTVAWRDHEATVEEIATWFDGQHAEGYPVLVADVAGERSSATRAGRPSAEVTGFPGYRHTAELTVHVDERHHGEGVGR